MSTTISANVLIHNAPEYGVYSKYKYIIAVVGDGEIWWYGADNSFDKATEVAKNLGNGIVLENTEYEV